MNRKFSYFIINLLLLHLTVLSSANLVYAVDASNVTCLSGAGVDTAIGCIPFNPGSLAVFFLRWALGIGGGIALLLMGYASIIIMASSGDPKKAQAGKEMFTAAISGLLLIIFSTFILRFFGITLFEIF